MINLICQGNIFNFDLISKDYFNCILHHHLQSYPSSLLILEDINCFKSTIFKTKLDESDLKSCFVHNLLGNIYQPAKLSWNKPLTFNISQKWQRWMLSTEKTHTSNGIIRQKGYSEIVRFISQAWDELDVELIRDSFGKAGK